MTVNRSIVLWRVAIVTGIIILATGGFFVYFHYCLSGLSYDPQEDIFTGMAARDRIDAKLSESACDFWVFDGGTFNGSIFYSSFRCQSIDDCWKALNALGAPEQTSFIPNVKTKFAVNLHGPKFYWPKLETPCWNLAVVTNGMSCERNHEDRQLEFWAVDLDKKRVFYHRESGGFSTDPPDKQ